MIEIRKMTIEDFEKISDNLEEKFDEFWKPSILKSELENPNSHYVVAIEDEEVLGFAGIIVSLDDSEITNIVVRKDIRKKGIGTMLLEKLIEMSKDLKKDSISLEVNEKNYAAIKLYESLDFKALGSRKKYYNGKDDAIIMTKKI